MKLLQLKYRNDFGDDYYLQFLTGKKWTLIQTSVSWNDFPSWPYVQITMGSNGLIGVMFWVYKLGFDLDIMSRTWRWDYAEKLDEEKECSQNPS
jgi:hypothetical protein